jgi:hypothetical protein
MVLYNVWRPFKWYQAECVWSGFHLSFSRINSPFHLALEYMSLRDNKYFHRKKWSPVDVWSYLPRSLKILNIPDSKVRGQLRKLRILFGAWNSYFENFLLTIISTALLLSNGALYDWIQSWSWQHISKTKTLLSFFSQIAEVEIKSIRDESSCLLNQTNKQKVFEDF